MVGIITRSNHTSLFWPGINDMFGLYYKEQEQYWSQFFETKTSKMAEEVILELSGFGLAVEKLEGEPVLYDSTMEGPKTRFQHVVYALGFTITREHKEDNLYRKYGLDRARLLGTAMRTTKELVHHHTLNMAFDPLAAGADGQPLVSTQHPINGGTLSNRIAVAADLSEVAIEDMITQMSLMRDNRGHFIQVNPKCLVIHPSNMFLAHRILGSEYQPNSESNNINVIKAKGLVPKVVSTPYLTSPGAFFLLTDVPNGLLSFQRRKLEFLEYNKREGYQSDFDTHNSKYQANERYAAGFADWRIVVASPGP